MPGRATTEGSGGQKAVHDLARSPERIDTTPAASLPFVLTPTPATPISHEQCVVAVALADQLGATMAKQGSGG
jgi:hypothetical protein